MSDFSFMAAGTYYEKYSDVFAVKRRAARNKVLQEEASEPIEKPRREARLAWKPDLVSKALVGCQLGSVC